MTKININSKQTELAWEKLYTRFEQDGLLPDNEKPQSEQKARLGWVKWAAAIVILCISAASIYMYQTFNTSPASMLAVHNEDLNSTLATTLEDGSMVFLANNAWLKYPEHFADNKREVILEGDALFEVSGNPERPFLIEAGKIQIEVIGTAFHVKNPEDGPFEVSVQSGKVKVSHKESSGIKYVNGGETVRLTSSGLEVFKTRDFNQLDQILNRIQFKDVPLNEIIKVVNRENNDVQLAVAPTLANRRLTVSFYKDTPETMAKLICAALKLTYTHDQNILMISEP